MLYKYDKKRLEQEIYSMNLSKYVKVTNYDQRYKCLEVLLYNIETKYEIYFYMDISSSNNNFFKRNSQIKTPGIYSPAQINLLISKFYQTYTPELHNNLIDFFQLLKNYLDENLSQNQEEPKEKEKESNTKVPNIIIKLENSSTIELILLTLLIHLCSILIKILVGRFGYSG